MTRLAALALVLASLAACTPPGRYPISGQTCGPDDPVLDMSPPCLPLSP